MHACDATPPRVYANLDASDRPLKLAAAESAHDDDSLLLLQLGAGGGLGLQIMDGGTIQFRVAPAALAAGDWSAAMAYADSC